jgi:transcriptional regulator with XRE-family HTH domain
MIAAQFRMARAALGLTVRELAEKAGVHKNTVIRIEAGLASHGPTIAAVRRTLEEAGLEFIPEEEGIGGPGVRIKWGIAEPRLLGTHDNTTGKFDDGLHSRAWDEDSEDSVEPNELSDGERAWLNYVRTNPNLSVRGREILLKTVRM